MYTYTAMDIRRPVVRMPMFLMRPAARLFETVLPRPPITTGQLLMLEEDNVCGMQDSCENCAGAPGRFSEGLKRFLGKA